jgi:hypothetical protein
MKFAPTAVLLCTAALVGVVLAQPKSDRPAQPHGASPEDMKKHMDEMKSAASPGPMHASLTRRAGSYTVKCQFWMDAARTGDAMESSGEATLKAALDGRFLTQEETGTMMGAPFSTFKYWGYNNEAQRFEAMWSYTGSTAMMRLSGTSTDGGKTVTYTAEYAGSKEKFDIVTRELSADSFSIELVGVHPDGGKGATMVSTYTRKK